MSTTNEKVEILKKLPLFKSLKDNEIVILATSLVEKSFSTAEVLIEQDDQSDSAFIIADGNVKVYRLTDSGEEINLAILGKGDIVGELSLLDDEPRSAYVETITETKILLLTRDNFLRILTDHIEIDIDLLKTLSLRVRASDEKVEYIMSKSLTERTWKALQTLSSHFPENNITLSQEEIAEIIGATRARVTESLNELAKLGKITISHRKIHVN